MGKSNKKKDRSLNGVVVSNFSKKFNVSKRFVNQCLNNERHSITAEEIKKEYKILIHKLDLLFNE